MDPVVLYEHANRQGLRVPLGAAGLYAGSAELGPQNLPGGIVGELSSLEIAPGYEVTLFEGSAGSGASVVLGPGIYNYTGDTPYGWNDRARSVVVRLTDPAAAIAAGVVERADGSYTPRDGTESAYGGPLAPPLPPPGRDEPDAVRAFVWDAGYRLPYAPPAGDAGDAIRAQGAAARAANRSQGSNPYGAPPSPSAAYASQFDRGWADAASGRRATLRTGPYAQGYAAQGAGFARTTNPYGIVSVQYRPPSKGNGGIQKLLLAGGVIVGGLLLSRPRQPPYDPYNNPYPNPYGYGG